MTWVYKSEYKNYTSSLLPHDSERKQISHGLLAPHNLSRIEPLQESKGNAKADHASHCTITADLIFNETLPLR